MTLYYRPFTAPPPRKRLTHLREDLCEAQNWHCCYCTGVMQKLNPKEETGADATVDHFVPHKFQGTDDKDNLIGACRGCNEARGCMKAYAFYGLRKKLRKAGVWDPCTMVTYEAKEAIREYAERRKQVRLDAARFGLSRQDINALYQPKKTVELAIAA